MSWTLEQAVALAPDSASVSAAQKLSQSKHWSLLAYNEQAVWGLCQGSGAKPYQTQVDLNGPAFKCSCPSRKFPCKHGLALLFVLAQQPSQFSQTPAAPDWVAEWLASRAQKAATAKPSSSPVVDQTAQLKRQQQRVQRVNQGVAELQLWLEDRVRLGLAELQHQDYSYWANLRARLIDAQAPGLANRVTELGEAVMSAKPPAVIANAMGRLQLLLSAYAQLPQWPEALQAEIRSQIGWSQAQETLLSQTPVLDQWLVLQHQQVVQERLIQQRIWCWGLQSGRRLQIVNFAPENQRHLLLVGWLPGQVMQANAYFYPSPTPLRAVITDSQLSSVAAQLPSSGISLKAMRQEYQRLLMANPWLGPYPFQVEGRVLLQQGQAVLQLRDEPLAWPVLQSPWPLLALTASMPSQFMLLWDGELLRILGLHSQYSGSDAWFWFNNDGTLLT